MSLKPDQLNESHFLDCCGSRRWARKMAEARPFRDISDLVGKAENIWKNLNEEDWLEAFAAHPKIGAKKAARETGAQAAEWSRGEQAGMEDATGSEQTELEKLNYLYEEKFGFIFIVCATGKSAGEMLEICRRRLENADEAEISVAADEQRRITEIRLRKLLEAEI